MMIFIAGLVLFFGPHLFTAFRSRAPDRDIAKSMGGPYRGLYSLVSLVGFAAMIWGFSQMPRTPMLYTPPDWARHVALGFMFPALILLASAYLPTGRIKKITRHPMLAAVKLWALVHLLANGELRSVMLFGAFLAYGVIARIALKRRGDNGPATLAKNAALWDLAAVGIGAALYLIIGRYAHLHLFGVQVMG